MQNSKIATPAFLNATGNGADGWKSLSYAQLSSAFDQGVALQPEFGYINTDDPDLRGFKARGGKLIQYHGLNDILIFPQGSFNYYDRVVRAMRGGLEEVQDFYRLYFVPGMSHGPGNGTSNPNANPPYPATGQIYQLLLDWVEKGNPPKNVVVTSQSTVGTQKSLPLCEYPSKVTYVSGNPLVASSYTCRPNGHRDDD